MSKKIKYIAFYSDSKDTLQNRQAALAAVQKINYISDTLANSGYKVNIISPAWTDNKKGFYCGYSKRISNNIELTLFHTFSSGFKYIRMFKYIYSLMQLFFYLLFHVRKREQVLVYHSIALILPVQVAKFIKGFTLILEVEEIYQDLQYVNPIMKRLEYHLIHKADKLIFASKELNKKFNKDKKPAVTIYGAYTVQKDRKVSFLDNKIHVVYSGTLDPRKGGALAAIYAAKYLPDNYHVHILGFGSPEEIKDLTNRIEKINKTATAALTYEGIVYGEAYNQFLQKCQIGLSTYKSHEDFCNTSFPSKILTYLSNGLQVVAGQIQSIEDAPMGKLLHYYEQQTPQAIAEAIVSVDISRDYDSRSLVKELDILFKNDLNRLLKMKDTRKN
ncbi:hypothetical protein acsn021_09680 [Anaerocolumna cellulosilytica]|uniref:Uncharacterized protein n=1 Tax=Anaerocolumna cellulosilytica TaxID=433286 RepID=A0A6S6QWG1_9FIRM|nr:glycosyltransferase [Anaerocolumna cellulosilytica]MBB5194454.1 hypothetical protein [Anaerocolumna cellulosilytica]BCJ93399.1 hypothetical protein acsn021_09680 [Anaerocolumna cellulosilytica]